jgi:antitoxin MazE
MPHRVRWIPVESHVRKWGNSLALRIPKALAVEAGLSEGSRVEIELEGDRLSVRAVRTEAHSLAELLAGVTPENRHGEIETGPSVGREVW